MRRKELRAPRGRNGRKRAVRAHAFSETSTALVGHGGSIVLPPLSTDVHHEVELVAVIGRGGKNIAVDNALDYVDGYAVGLDMTARDLQQKAKEAGRRGRLARVSTLSRRLGRERVG